MADDPTQATADYVGSNGSSDKSDRKKKIAGAMRSASKEMGKAGQRQIERSTEEAASRSTERGPMGTQREVPPLQIRSFRKGGKVRKGQVIRAHKGERVRKRKGRSGRR
jgi:hypothetical protein